MGWVLGQGVKSFDSILSTVDSGISVNFSGGTLSIQDTSSEIVFLLITWRREDKFESFKFGLPNPTG